MSNVASRDQCNNRSALLTEEQVENATREVVEIASFPPIAALFSCRVATGFCSGRSPRIEPARVGGER